MAESRARLISIVIALSSLNQTLTLPVTPLTYAARLVRLINADTLEVELDLGLGLTSRQRIQLRNVDAPELGRPGGVDAFSYVAELLTGADLEVTPHSQDSFGRWLSDVTADAQSVNDLLSQFLGAAVYV